MRAIRISLATLGAGLALLVNGCGPGRGNEVQFCLLPVPDQFSLEGASNLAPGDLTSYYLSENADIILSGDRWNDLIQEEDAQNARMVLQVDTTLVLKPEGYLLMIEPDRVILTGIDDTGLFYGLKTLEQLMEDAEDQEAFLPLCSIRDDPELAYRAIHLDLKHHLERTPYYYQLMDELAGLKINAVIVEMEDKLAYTRQPVVGSADALSVDEWTRLSNYARDRHIEISPLIQGLGHASYILKHDEYAGLRDDPESDWAFNPLDPGTYEVQFDLYLDALDATPHGRFLHVGGDEVHTTGRESGRSPLDLQLYWLNRVCAFAAEQNRIPVFWDDMPIKHAGLYQTLFDTSLTRVVVDSLWNAGEGALVESLDLFPKNCVYMRWNYSQPQAEGNIRAMEWFLDNGLKVMGATAGQTRWVLMPQNESNMENIRSFAVTSAAKGLGGLLLTLWDDDSPHFELYKRGIAAFAEYTWSGDVRSKKEVKAAYRQRAFGPKVADEAYAFIDRLEQPVRFWNNALLQSSDRRQIAGLEDPAADAVIDLPDPQRPGEWSARYQERLLQSVRTLNQCDSVERAIRSAMEAGVRNRYRLKVYEQVNRLARFTPQVLLALQAFDLAASPEVKENSLKVLNQLPEHFNILRKELEGVYGETRLPEKPAGYILDQDHHRHLANQSLSMDWLFWNELFFLEKLRGWLEKHDQ